MTKNMYLVLSVREIKSLLAVATASERVHGNGDNHCIVLRDLQTSVDHPDQISSTSLAFSMAQIAGELA